MKIGALPNLGVKLPEWIPRTSAECEAKLNEATITYMHRVETLELSQRRLGEEDEPDSWDEGGSHASDLDDGGGSGNSTLQGKSYEIDAHFSSTYVLMCLRITQHLANLENQDFYLRRFISHVVSLLKKAAFRRIWASGDREYAELYSTRLESLELEHQDCVENIRSMQSKVGIRKNEYMSLVNEYREIENNLEKILAQEAKLHEEKEKLERSLFVLRREVEITSEEHDKRVEVMEALSKEISAKSQQLYEQVQVRRQLNFDIVLAKDKLENVRNMLESENGMVPAKLVKRAEKELAELQQSIKSRERAFQVRQVAYIDIARNVQKQEDLLEKAKQDYRNLVQEHNDRLRSLTPRPQFDDGFDGFLNEDEKVDAETNGFSTVYKVEKLVEFIEKHQIDGAELFQAKEKLEKLQSQLLEARAALQIIKAQLPRDAPESEDGFTGIDPAPPKFFAKTSKSGETVRITRNRESKEDLPLYLRYDGEIHVRSISASELLNIVNDIWRLKYAKEAGMSSAERSHLSLFLYDYLQRSYGVQSVIAKWGFNILMSLKQHKDVTELEMFYLILEGRLPEESYFDQVEMLEAMYEHLETIHRLEGERRTREISKQALKEFLLQFFPHLPKVQMEMLNASIDRHFPQDFAHIDILMTATSADIQRESERARHEKQEEESSTSQQVSNETETTSQPLQRQNTMRPSWKSLFEPKQKSTEHVEKTFIELVKEFHLGAVKCTWDDFCEQLTFTASRESCTAADIIAAFRKVDSRIQDQTLTEYVGLAFDVEREHVSHLIRDGTKMGSAIAPALMPRRPSSRNSFKDSSSSAKLSLLQRIDKTTMLKRLCKAQIKPTEFYNPNIKFNTDSTLTPCQNGIVTIVGAQKRVSRWNQAKRNLQSITLFLNNNNSGLSNTD